MPSFSWIILLLSKLNSPQLSVLEFSISASDIGALNLEGLAIVLAHKRCDRSLRRLIFNVVPRSDTIGEAEKRIKNRLSSLTTDGLVVDVVNADPCSRLI